MKTKYEYLVTAIAPDGFTVADVLETRREARHYKQSLINYYKCTSAKIIQRKYELKDEKVVR